MVIEKIGTEVRVKKRKNFLTNGTRQFIWYIRNQKNQHYQKHIQSTDNNKQLIDRPKIFSLKSLQKVDITLNLSGILIVCIFCRLPIKIAFRKVVNCSTFIETFSISEKHIAPNHDTCLTNGKPVKKI